MSSLSHAIPAKQDPADNQYHSSLPSAYDGLRIYLRDIGSWKQPSRTREGELLDLYWKGDTEARTELIMSHLPLVVRIAQGLQRPDIPILELIAEGNIGLLKALERFKAQNRCRLASYAYPWVRNAMVHVLGNYSRIIRIPPKQLAKLNRLSKSQDTETPPQPAGTNPGLLQATAQPLSLQAPLTTGGQLSLADTLPDHKAHLFSEENEEQLSIARLESMINQLPRRQHQILALRYGLNGYPPHTLADIGEKLGVTHEAIRQALGRIISHLRTAHLLHEEDCNTPALPFPLT